METLYTRALPLMLSLVGRGTKLSIII